MESEESEVDELANLDFAQFSQAGANFSAFDQLNGRSDELQECLTTPDDTKAHDVHQDRNDFFMFEDNFDSNVSPNSNHWQSNPFNDTSTFLTGYDIDTDPFCGVDPFPLADVSRDDKIGDPFSLGVDPFTPDVFSKDAIGNTFSSVQTMNEEGASMSPSPDGAHLQTVYLNRLPGENLGMVLGIEGDQDNIQTIDAVLVKSVTPGGAAARACQGKKKICVGDEILEIDGLPLKELTHDECFALFQDLPDHVALTVHRKGTEIGIRCESVSVSSEQESQNLPMPPIRKQADNMDTALGLYENHMINEFPGVQGSDSAGASVVPKDFLQHVVIISRGENEESLGLSIVPSYGDTCDLYQIKQLLPTGTCARSGQLEIGDRLLSCNGYSLKGVTQAHCLQVLKSSGNLVQLTVLRHTPSQAPLSENHSEALSSCDWPETDQSHVNHNTHSCSSGRQELLTSGQNQNPFADTNSHFGNECHPVNVQDAYDTDHNLKLGPTDDICLEDFLRLDKERNSSIHIPPPLEFSDLSTYQAREIDNTQVGISDQVTNIDDLLFGELDDKTNAAYQTADKNVLLEKPEKNCLSQGCLLESFQDPSTANSQIPADDFLNCEFSGRSIEDFAEECFNNIGLEDTPIQSEKGDNNSNHHNTDVSFVQEESQVGGVINGTSVADDHVTVLPHTTELPLQYISTIPISLINREVPSSLGEANEKRPTYTTNIHVNSPPSVNVSHIDIVSTKDVVSPTQPSAAATSTREASNSVVFYTHSGSSPSSVKSASIKIDGVSKECTMGDKANHAVPHTLDTVLSNGQSGEHSIQSVTLVAKDQLSSAQSPQPVGDLQEEQKQINADVEREIVAADTTPSTISSFADLYNGVSKEMMEKEITPNFLSQDRKEAVLNDLNPWDAVDSRKVASGWLNSQESSVLPPNTTVHTTLSMTTKALQGDGVEPMVVAKDYQETILSVPSATASVCDELEVTVIDEAAKNDIGNFLVPVTFSSSYEKQAVVQQVVSGFKYLNKEDITPDNGQDTNTYSYSQSNLHSVSEPTTVVEEVVQVSTAVDLGIKPDHVKEKGDFSEKFIEESGNKLEQVVVGPKPDVHSSAVNTEIKVPQNLYSDEVVMRRKPKELLNSMGKTDNFQQSPELSSDIRRPKSMIEVSSQAPTPSRFDDIRKGLTIESKLGSIGSRPLSAMRPLSASTNRLSAGFSSSSSFLARTNKAELPKSRQENGTLFQVDVLKGIVGLGLKLKVTPEGQAQVIEIQRAGPIDKDGNVRVGDYVLSINSTELTGQTEARVQQVLRLLPRGLAKLVVSSVPPVSSSEHSESSDGSAYGVQLSPKPFTIGNHQSASLSVRENRDGVLTSKARNSLPTVDLAQFQMPLSARNSGAEQGTGSVQLTVQSKPIPQPADEVVHPETVPQQSYSTIEHSEMFYEDATARELQNSKYSKTEDVEIVNVHKKPADAKISLEHHSDFQSSIDKFEDKSSSVVPPKQKLVALSTPKHIQRTSIAPANVLLPHVKPFKNRETVSSVGPVSAAEHVQTSSTLPAGRSSPPIAAVKEAAAVAQERELPLKANVDRKVETQPMKSPPQKVPPPVAPKPGLNSSSIDEKEQTSAKSVSRISAGYERLQAITMTSKPSKVIEQSRTFVSSTAKFFDSKTNENETGSEQSVHSHRISLGVMAQCEDGQSEGGKSMNTSLMPVKERRKSAGPTFSSSPLVLSQPASLISSSLARPMTLNTTGWPEDIVIPQNLSEEHDSPDSKTKTMLSPTPLNAALSPRRNTSSDSPTSPPLSYSPKKVSRSKDILSVKSTNDKNQPEKTEHSGIYTFSPVILHANVASLSQVHEFSPSPAEVASSHSFTHEQHSGAFTFPIQSAPQNFQLHKEALEHTMKKFDDLLMDTPVPHAQTDPSDLLLEIPISQDGPVLPEETSPKLSDNEAILLPSILEIKKPVAAPRSRSFPKVAEVTRDTNSPLEAKDEKQKESGQTAYTHKENVLNSSMARTALDEVRLIAVEEVSESTQDLLSHQSDQTDNEKSRLFEHSVDSPSQSWENKGTNRTQETIEVASESSTVSEIDLLREPDNDFTRTVPKQDTQEYENKYEIISEIQKQCSDNNVNTDLQSYQDESRGTDPYWALASRIVENVLASIVADPDMLSKEVEYRELQMEVESPSAAASEDVSPVLGAIHEESSVNTDLQSNQDESQGTDPYWAQALRIVENVLASTVYKESSVNTDLQSYQDESHGTDLYSAQASRIVENVLASIVANPVLLSQEVKDTELKLEVEPSDDEPPPLPGAPPPPLFTGDHLSPLIPDHVLQQKVEELEIRQASNEQVNIDSSEFFLMEKSETINGHDSSIAVSDELLNSSFHEENVHRVNSPSSIDLLSEDSGMPADEDQGMATDEAISPPGEFSETVSVSDTVKGIQFSSEKQISSSSASFDQPDGSSNQSKGRMREPLLKAQSHLHCQGQNEEKNIEKDLPPPLIPASAPSCLLPPNAILSSQDLLSPVSASSVQASASLPLSQEATSLGEDLLSAAMDVSVPATTKHEQVSRSLDDFAYVSIVSSQATRSLQPSTPETTEVSSKRRWCLISNRNTGPVLLGNSGVSVVTQYTQPTLVQTLPFPKFLALLDKANTVLDTVVSADNLELIVLHLYREGDSVPVGVDLKKVGQSQYQVSDIKDGSLAWEGGAVKEDDLLVAMDTLWCDDVTVMGFLARLTKPKQDSLLVFARRERTQANEVSLSCKPVPTPRPRTSFKLQSQSISVEDKNDKNMSVTTVKVPEPAAVVSDQKGGSHAGMGRDDLEQTNLHSDKAPSLPAGPPPLPDKAPPLPQEAAVFLNQEASTLPAQAPPLLPAQAPLLLPAQAPPLLPAQVPSPLLPAQPPPLLTAQAPPLLSAQAPPLLPAQAPSPLLPAQAPSPLLPAQPPSPLLPAQAPSPLLPAQPPSPLLPAQPPPLLPAQAPPLLPAQTPSPLLPTQPPSPLLPAQPPSPLLPAQASPLLPAQPPPLLPAQAPSSLLPAQAPPPLPAQAPPLLPTQAPPLLPEQTSQPILNHPSLFHDDDALVPKKVAPPVHKKPARPQREASRKSESESDEALAKARPSSVAPVPFPPSGLKNETKKTSTTSIHHPDSKTEAPVPSQTGAVTEQPDGQAAGSQSPTLRSGIHTVVMIKGATGVGFCLEGGIGSPRGNLPISIKRIFKGGPAEKCGQLQVKDEILEVNGMDFTNMRHYEAWNHLKFLDDGEVHIKIHRH